MDEKIIYKKPYNGVVYEKRKYHGVTYNKQSKRWVAYIRVDGKVKYLGYFKTFEEALSVRLNAEKEVNGNG